MTRRRREVSNDETSFTSIIIQVSKSESLKLSNVLKVQEARIHLPSERVTLQDVRIQISVLSIFSSISTTSRLFGTLG